MSVIESGVADTYAHELISEELTEEQKLERTTKKLRLQREQGERELERLERERDATRERREKQEFRWGANDPQGRIRQYRKLEDHLTQESLGVKKTIDGLLRSELETMERELGLHRSSKDGERATRPERVVAEGHRKLES